MSSTLVFFIIIIYLLYQPLQNRILPLGSNNLLIKDAFIACIGYIVKLIYLIID